MFDAVVKIRTLEPEALPTLMNLELPSDRLSSDQATKPKRLGAICRLESQSARRWRRRWKDHLRWLGAIRLAALSAACRLSDLLGRNGSLAYALLF
jgi:hypothetical protein